jgi:hypothetical protein
MISVYDEWFRTFKFVFIMLCTCINVSNVLRVIYLRLRFSCFRTFQHLVSSHMDVNEHERLFNFTIRHKYVK